MTEQTITLSADALVEKIKELRDFVSSYKAVEQKINLQQMTEAFDPDQMASFTEIREAIQVVDDLMQKNYDSAVAQVITAAISTLGSDAVVRRNFLMETDRKAKKIEVDADLKEKIEEAKRRKSDIQALHTLLVNMKVKLPNSIYKEGRTTKDGKKGEKLLDLPRIEDVSEDGEVSKRGRPATAMAIVLGTVEDGETTWYESVNHIGEVFTNLYGSIRADHNQLGLFKAVSKTDQSVTQGWETPVEYAGRLWVAKVRKSS